jgi:transcriptional regulator with XRE-family HTH domain
MKRLSTDETPNYFGVALRYIFRSQKRGLQKELAEKLGISNAQIQRIMTGVSTGSVATRNAIGKALGTTHEDMLALGRKLIDRGEDMSRPAPAVPGRGACLNAEAVAWWPDIVRYIEMVNLAAQGNDPELYLDVVEALIREATAVVNAARERIRAERGGADAGDDSKRSDVEVGAKGAGGC